MQLITAAFKSGRDTDKIKEMKLHLFECRKSRSTVTAESPINIECKVQQTLRLGTHDMYVAELVAFHADEKYMDEKGRFSLEKAHARAYSHGTYFALGEKLVTF